MFTGIVEGTGVVTAATTDEGGRRLRIEPPTAIDAAQLQHGQSIAVSGACLTVESSESAAADTDGWFEVFLAAETVDKTYLGEVNVGDRVNIERALAANDRFDGHLVQGHVDMTAQVTSIDRVGDDWTFGFDLPTSIAPYVVQKGSITIDGISLTIAERDAEEFSVAIIPTTYEVTTLSDKAVGDPVHLEVDVVAKYVEQLTSGYREADI
ncbi:riboflavin synthase [Haloquadratum walsbyi]|uniref:Riboflavin synthase n=1 Tax=Haloquadratum walsbyi J07HQW2 TaxID=1238425 RepID=U1PR55_9EURY|nr:riboflavin synthase [Haloquadratum walsbyi]ERG96252.1 MAG: riboflavin synthase, alpha subunit [Haloquadratum walsbyi J07HQW2]